MSAEVSCATGALPVPSGRSRANRVAMVLLAAITGLLLTLGALGWWFMAGIDERYSQVLEQTATSMNELHEIGLHAFTGYGTVMELRQLRDPTERAARLKILAGERAANDRLYEKLDRILIIPEQRTLLQEVITDRLRSRKQAQAIMAEPFEAASTQAGIDESVELLRSCVAYQQACDKLTDRIQEASGQASRQLAAEVRHMRWLFLGVGVLPIVGAAIFLMVSLGLLQVVKIDGEEE